MARAVHLLACRIAHAAMHRMQTMPHALLQVPYGPRRRPLPTNPPPKPRKKKRLAALHAYAAATQRSDLGNYDTRANIYAQVANCSTIYGQPRLYSWPPFCLMAFSLSQEERSCAAAHNISVADVQCFSISPTNYFLEHCNQGWPGQLRHRYRHLYLSWPATALCVADRGTIYGRPQHSLFGRK